MARDCPAKKQQFRRDPPPQQGFRKKSFPPRRTQGFRKRNKFIGHKPMHARAAYIEEIDQEDDEQYEEEEEETVPDLAARTSRLSDDKKERLVAELKALDISF